MSAAAPHAASEPAYHRPATLEEALALLAQAPLQPLAGGTDHFPARVGRALDDDVLDLSAIASLRGIEPTGDGWRIGAMTTWTDLLRAPELPPLFDGYRAAAREVGGVQVQNAGTLGGNLCNASPAADGTPNLMALDAEVELRSTRGTRRVAVAAFVLGNRETARAPDELVVALHVPRPAGAATSHFFKLGARRYLVISVVMVATVLVRDGAGCVADARVVVGACSSVATRLRSLEARLRGLPCEPGMLAASVSADDLSGLAPIDDARGSAAYRREAAAVGVARSLAMAAMGSGPLSVTPVAKPLAGRRR